MFANVIIIFLTGKIVVMENEESKYQGFAAERQTRWTLGKRSGPDSLFRSSYIDLD